MAESRKRRRRSAAAAKTPKTRRKSVTKQAKLIAKAMNVPKADAERSWNALLKTGALTKKVAAAMATVMMSVLITSKTMRKVMFTALGKMAPACMMPYLGRLQLALEFIHGHFHPVPPPSTVTGLLVEFMGQAVIHRIGLKHGNPADVVMAQNAARMSDAVTDSITGVIDTVYGSPQRLMRVIKSTMQYVAGKDVELLSLMSLTVGSPDIRKVYGNPQWYPTTSSAANALDPQQRRRAVELWTVKLAEAQARLQTETVPAGQAHYRDATEQFTTLLKHLRD